MSNPGQIQHVLLLIWGTRIQSVGKTWLYVSVEMDTGKGRSWLFVQGMVISVENSEMFLTI